MSKEIFVFGSNLDGVHGAGAAKRAYEHHGAIWGQGEGIMGDSYAIPTKGSLNSLTGRLSQLPLWQVEAHVAVFKMFAHSRPDLTFVLTPIGCGLAGRRYRDIAPMFKGSPSNVRLPHEFQQVLGGF